MSEQGEALNRVAREAGLPVKGLRKKNSDRPPGGGAPALYPVGPDGKGEDPTGEKLREMLTELAMSKPNQCAMRQGEMIFVWLCAHGRLVVDADMPSLDGVYWIDSREEGAPIRRLAAAGSKEYFGSIFGMVCIANDFEKVRAAAAQKAVATAAVPRVTLSLWWECKGVGREKVVYISCGSGNMVKISAGAVEIVLPGHDGILIPEEASLPSWNLVPEESEMPPDALEVFKSSSLSGDHRNVLAAAIIAMPAMRANDNPPLCIEGPNGSGKSTILRLAGRIFDPSLAEISVGVGLQKSLDRGCSNRRLMIFDNLDQPRDQKWIVQAIEAKSTGAASLENRHYRNGETIGLPSRAAFWMSSIDASFLLRSGGYAHRAILLKAFEKVGAPEDEKLDAELTANRSAILSFIARTLSKAIDSWEDRTVKFRFPAWARMVLAVARVLSIEDRMAGVLDSIQMQAHRRSVEASTFGAALLESLPESGNEFVGTARELFSSLGGKEALGGETTATALGSYLGKSRTVLGTFFRMSDKIRTGTTVWTITRA